MLQRMKIRASGAQGVSLVLLWLWLAGGCAPEPARASPDAPARRVRVVAAERSSRPLLTEVIGSVRAVRSSTIAALISGTVVQVRAGLGTTVRAGEVLVKLSAREIDARLEQARALSALATPERDRAAQLMRLGAISAARHDEAISQWSIAQAKQAEATAIADYTLVRAPFAGVVSAKLTNVGDIALPGQPLLVVEAPEAFRFEARVPESMALRALWIGRSISIKLDGVEREILGTVAELQPASDEATRTQLVKLDLSGSSGLRSGRFGRLLLATGSASVVTVPSEALVRHGQLEGVFVVEGGSARLRLVRSARERNGELVITAGLSGGERVVASPSADLRDGQPVEVTP